MNWIWHLLTPTLVLLATTSSKELDSNDITVTQASINLDSTLRKALLRALTELENEEQEKEIGVEGGNSKTVFYSTTARSDSDKIVEKASASAVSFFAQEGSTSTERVTTTELTDKPVVVIQKSSGVAHKPIISVLNDEGFLASASSGFSDDRNNFVKLENYKSNINQNSVTVNDKSITAGVKAVSITPKPEATTVIPTSSTAENEAKVEDVQFFSAPLVAAFTVHQDERGLPKKVEPIYKVAGHMSVSSKQLEQQKQQELSQQLDIHEKQKQLEQEIFKLQQQKSQQDYFLRQQQLLLQQQLQNQRILAEQGHLSQTERPFIPIVNPIQSTPSFSLTTNHGSSSNQYFTNKDQFNQNSINQFSTQQNQNSINQFSTNQNQNSINQFTTTQNNQNSLNQFTTNQNLNNQFSTNQHNQNSNNQFSPNQNQNSIHQFATSQNQNQFATSQRQNAFTTNHNLANQNAISSKQNQNSINQIVPSIQLQNNQNQFTPLRNNQFKQSHVQNNTYRPFNTLVSLQPSLSLSSTSLPLNAQILPVRSAVDFRPQQNTFNQFLTPPIQQDNDFLKFQNFQNSFVQSLPQVQHNTRVFRQESQVANPGFNNQYNQFQQPQNTRFFRSNLESFHTRAQPQNVNQHLNNLLYHSGITRNIKQNDDLNIVSKILSYNVGRDNYFSGSRLSEHRVPKIKGH